MTSGPPTGDSSPVHARTGASAVASGKSPKGPNPVVGRDVELTEVEDLLTDARSGQSGALLIVGEPGIGKTTLLESARSRADGFTLLSAQGVEPDSALAHAALLELV